LKEQSDRAIVHMLPTPQLSWLDLGAGRQRRVVEGPHCGVILIMALSHLLVSLHEKMRILHHVREWIGITSIQQIYSLIPRLLNGHLKKELPLKRSEILEMRLN
jgi:hypothetical protein